MTTFIKRTEEIRQNHKYDGVAAHKMSRYQKVNIFKLDVQAIWSEL